MGAAATGFPVIPAGYAGGTIIISAAQAGTPQNLLALIQAQLNPNVTAAKWMRIQADATGTLYGGQQYAGGGTNLLSTSNYAWSLTSSNPPLIYYSSFPGADVPLGDIWVFMTISAVFHVELYN